MIIGGEAWEILEHLKIRSSPVFELFWNGPVAKIASISLLRCGKPKHIYAKFTKSLVNNPVSTFNLEITGLIDPSFPFVALIGIALKFSLIVRPSFYSVILLLM